MTGWYKYQGNASVHKNSGVLTYQLKSEDGGYLCGNSTMLECANPPQQTVIVKLNEDRDYFHLFIEDCGEITQTFVCEPCNRDALTMWFNDGSNSGNKTYNHILYYNNWSWSGGSAYIDSKNIDECRIIVIDNTDTHDSIHIGGQKFDTSEYDDSSYPFIAKLNDKGEPISSDTISGETVYFPEKKYEATTYQGHKIKYHIEGGSAIVIPNNFFSGSSENDFNSDLVEVYFQGNIKEIEDGTTHNGAFSNCHGLSALTLNNIEKVGRNAFNGCTALTYVDFGHWCSSGSTSTNLKTIGNGAFSGCTSIIGITILPGLKTIDRNAFASCTSLSSVNLPNTVTDIGTLAFSDCSSLASITIPDSVTSIGEGAFDETPWWNLYSANTQHHSGNTIYINDVAYKATATTITSVIFKDGTVGIGGGAFSGCTRLRSVEIPSTVTNIGGSAFEDCTSLTSITCHRSTPPILGAGAFYNTNIGAIYVPSGSVEAYKAADGWSDYANIINS